VKASIKQVFRISLAGLAFVGFGLGAVLLAWLVLPWLSLGQSQAVRRRRCQRAVQTTFIFFHDCMRGCGLVDFNSRDVPALTFAEPMVIVANHPTLIDVTAVLSAWSGVCVVAKRSWFRNPVIGPLLFFCGHIESGGQATEGDGNSVLEGGAQRLAEGHSVLLFPEGTRSPEEGLHRFRSGAFHLALRAHVPVLPVLITAEPPGLKKHQAWHAIPTRTIRLRIRPLECVPSVGYAEPRALQIAIRDQLTVALAGTRAADSA
jgi:1-acyl-sn-glycerol-3-phosphate acyltransferase